MSFPGLMPFLAAAGRATLGGCLLQPDSEYQTAPDGGVIAETLLLRYHSLSPWDNADAFPVVGDVWPLGHLAGANTATGWVVTQSRVIQDGSPSLYTELTLTLRHHTTQSSTTVELDPTADEVTWGREDRPISTHPHFAAADFAALKAWEAEPDATKKATLYAALNSLTAELADFIRGETTAYAFYSPVVSRTTRSYNPIGAGGAGFRQSPPHSAGLAPAWLKTASHATRTGRSGTWELREEWSGAVSWSSVLYP